MPLKDNELARREAGAIECRTEPLRVSWTLSDLASGDSHSLDIRFSCSVRVADNVADRRMFAEVFRSHESVTSEVLSQHFQRILLAAAAGLAAQSKAAEVVGSSDAQHQQWIAALREAANPVAFAAGLELLAPFQLDIESPTLQRQRLEEIARARAEARTAGQAQQLQRASELLKQFQELRKAAPDLPAGKLLEQISAADRGATLQTLLLATSHESRSTQTLLYAVSGNSLVRIDPRTSPPRLNLISLPQDLGPLRSVQSGIVDGKSVLLIGARSGVMIVEPQAPQNARVYPVPNLESQLGFNAAICTNGQLFATHAEAGVVAWRISEPTSPVEVFAETASQSPAAPGGADVSILVSGSVRSSSPTFARTMGARNLIPLDGSTIAYSLGNELIVRDHHSRTALPAHSHSEIIALLPTPRSIIAVHQDGTIAVLDRASRHFSEVRHRGGRITAAGQMPWLGDVRVLLATDEGPIDCIGLDDPLVTEYLSPYRGLKIVSASADLIAAVSPDRQRIILWNTPDPQRPAGEVHVTSQTRHRIADIEFTS
jgi:hypothetical protein